MKNVNENLKRVLRILRDIRDNQEEIPCLDEDNCICEEFDLIIDYIDILRNKFIKEE